MFLFESILKLKVFFPWLKHSLYSSGVALGIQSVKGIIRVVLGIQGVKGIINDQGEGGSPYIG